VPPSVSSVPWIVISVPTLPSVGENPVTPCACAIAAVAAMTVAARTALAWMEFMAPSSPAIGAGCFPSGNCPSADPES
jgi:hypothetical protein